LVEPLTTRRARNTSRGSDALWPEASTPVIKVRARRGGCRRQVLQVVQAGLAHLSLDRTAPRGRLQAAAVVQVAARVVVSLLRKVLDAP